VYHRRAPWNPFPAKLFWRSGTLNSGAMASHVSRAANLAASQSLKRVDWSCKLFVSIGTSPRC
jgi:hypothetical protein